MGKKKKKPQRSVPYESPRVSGHSEAFSPPSSLSKQQVGSSSETLDIVDHLFVRCVPGSQQGLSSPKHLHLSRTPFLAISQSDGRRLGIFPGQYVFLFPCGGTVRLKDHDTKPSFDVLSGSVCMIQIVRDVSQSFSTAPSSPFSIPPNSGGVETAQLPRGHVQIFPSSLATFLWKQDTKQHQTEIPVTTPTKKEPEQEYTSTPIARDKGISFKGFLSSEREKRNSSSKKPTPPIQHSTLWIVPVDSTLGSKIITSKTVKITSAKKIYLSVPNGVFSNANMVNYHDLLERLVRATHNGRFVQVGETLSTSFQGRTIELIALRMEGTKPFESESVSLEETFCKMHLNDDNSMAETQDHLIQSIQSIKVELFLVEESTKFFFSDPSQEVEQIHSDPEVPEQYVAGISPVVQKVKNHLLVPLTRPELFSYSKNILPPRGLLLHGPSGTGKTCLAKQIASELRLEYGCRVDFISCMSLLTKTTIVGEAERELSQYFRPTLTSDGPRLLIFDDVHMICSRRGGPTSQPGADQLAATLLALMDGVGHPARGDAPTVVLAITNDPSVLDPALRRPGRLDYEVEVPIPDEASQRADILRFHLDKTGFAQSSISNADLLDLAKNAKGYNGADCVLVVKAAVRLSLLGKQSDPLQRLELTKLDLSNAMRTVTPSAIKSVTVEIPQVLWSDIGGMDEVKETLKESIEMPLSRQELFEKLKIPAPRGILLYGPPGTGKTMIARALATEGKMNFLAVKGPELLSKWLGESERALASLFRRARMASPSIIFFDEIDAIATKRGSSDNSTGSRMLSQLLTELDGVVSTGRVVADEHGGQQQRVLVIGATNRPDLLDSALTRPGRIDRMVYVGLPDQRSREKVFQVALQKRACDEDVDFGRLAADEVSEGYSGAEITGICREAALLALEESIGAIDTEEFESYNAHPKIKMKHLLQVVRTTERQITREMLDFYASFSKTKN